MLKRCLSVVIFTLNVLICVYYVVDKENWDTWIQILR